ncbi:MAG: MerR family transcriptional regulator [Acidobacteria bacterium]|nr:MerR family transcriptional regulator [Acidobacteriota bacterium]
MTQPKVQINKQIPDKLFFKIGEVCELVEVEPHVLRYWEQEFPQLTPQKNQAGQRVYRRRDVEIAMRIKALREEEGFTIAGAKKRLAQEMRSGSKLKVVPMERPTEVARPAPPVEPPPPVTIEMAGPVAEIASEPPLPTPPAELETLTIVGSEFEETPPGQFSVEQKAALRKIRTELEALLTLLR